MKFRETDLPGVGKKYSVITSEGYKVSIIVHITGKREVFIFEPDDYDDALCSVLLTDEEANQIGSVLMGTFYKPEQEDIKEVLIENLAIEWLKVVDNSDLIGKSIKEENVRKKTGVTIIAIIKNDKKTLVNPPPETKIEKGDTLVIVGEREQIDKFTKIYSLSS